MCLLGFTSLSKILVSHLKALITKGCSDLRNDRLKLLPVKRTIQPFKFNIWWWLRDLLTHSTRFMARMTLFKLYSNNCPQEGSNLKRVIWGGHSYSSSIILFLLSPYCDECWVSNSSDKTSMYQATLKAQRYNTRVWACTWCRDNIPEVRDQLVKRPRRESNPGPPGTAPWALTTELQGRYGFNSCYEFQHIERTSHAPVASLRSRLTECRVRKWQLCYTLVCAWLIWIKPYISRTRRTTSALVTRCQCEFWLQGWMNATWWNSFSHFWKKPSSCRC